jgi:hypothetical protein
MSATPTFSGIFEVLAADQSDARLASRKALVLSRDRIDARLGKFLAASKSPTEFDARYDLVAEDFAGIVRVAADEIGHEDPDSLVETLYAHYRTADQGSGKCKKCGNVYGKCKCDEFVGDEPKIAGKPPWLKDDDDDSDDESKKDDDDSDDSEDDKKAPPFGKKDDDSDDDEDDDSKESKTADAVPLVLRTSAYQCECEHCGNRWKSHEQNPETCPQCGEMGEHETDEPEDTYDELGKQKGNKNGLFSSVHTAEDGNTGLAGPSPKMDKKRWTPKSVKPIDVPSERHPTIQKDVTEVIPKDNLTGPAHDMDEINAQTTTETLPTATDYDGGGFATGGEESGPNTKTFPKGDQASPVTKQIVEE